MDVKQRIESEIRFHKKAIDETILQLNHHKKGLDKCYLDIISDVDCENEQKLYGMMYEYSDRICKYIKQKKDLQDLIFVKINMTLTL